MVTGAGQGPGWLWGDMEWLPQGTHTTWGSREGRPWQVCWAEAQGRAASRGVRE